MVSLLSHAKYGYGYSKKQILDLTPKEFQWRVQDAFELLLHFEGGSEFKGRIVREDRRKRREHIESKGVRPPSDMGE